MKIQSITLTKPSLLRGRLSPGNRFLTGAPKRHSCFGARGLLNELAVILVATLLPFPGFAEAPPTAVLAQPTAKDIVLSAVATATSSPSQGDASSPPSGGDSQQVRLTSDGLVVTLLIPGPWGTLLPRSAAAPFKTGDRFRVKVLSPRDGEVAFYNTNPTGEITSKPILSIPVIRGLEIVTEEFSLTGTKGEDQLHVVLVPITVSSTAVAAGLLGESADPSRTAGSAASATLATVGGEGKPNSVLGWLRNLLHPSGFASKDIQVLTQDTRQSTFAVGGPGQGVAVTIRIVHQ